jgi:hypothetical protein
MCLISVQIFSTVALVLFALEKNEMNGMFVGQQNLPFFFGAKYLPLGFDLKIVVKLTENVLFEELPWQPIWYYRKFSR